MNNFIFENNTKIYFGKGCVKEYLACLVKRYDGNIMFCYGQDSAKKNGIYKEILSVLETTGTAIYKFPGITPHLSYSKVMEGAEFAKKHNAGLVLGAGGSSVTDFCKAVSLAAKYNGDVWADFWASPGIFNFKPLPTGIIPTIASTGSECNGKAVITNEKLKIRTGRNYVQCHPEFALFDPSYTYSVPEYQMISSSFGILANIMEIYFSGTGCDNVTDDIAEALIKNIIRNLQVAIHNPKDYTARSNLMWDAVLAGNRITRAGKRCSSWCSQMGYQLEAYTGCNYGEGMAVLLPVYYRHIYKNNLVKFKRFAINVWGITEDDKSVEETALAGIEALEKFIRENGLPADLCSFLEGKETDLEAAASSCTIIPGNCSKMPYKEIWEIFSKCI